MKEQKLICANVNLKTNSLNWIPSETFHVFCLVEG